LEVLFVTSPSHQQIEEFVRRVVEAEGLDLVDLEFKSGKPRGLLRITIDKPGGVTLGDCETVSTQVGTLLDVHDTVRDAYVLEVSSPGLDRPLRTDRDYERARDRYVKLILTTEDGRSEEAVGYLKDCNDQDLFLEQDGTIRVIGRSWIKRARQEVKIASPPKRKKGKRN
jgi:ribosome maturation factor RimP